MSKSRVANLKYDYDRLRMDFDHGYSENEFQLDFLHDKEMLYALERSELTDKLKACLGPVNLAVEDTEVVVMGAGWHWLLIDGKKTFSLRKYAQTLRLYDNDEHKVSYIDRPSLKQIALFNNVRYNTLQGRATKEKWTAERREQLGDLAAERKTAAEVAERGVYEAFATKHLAELEVMAEQGLENLENGTNKTTNRDFLQAIALMNTMQKTRLEQNRTGGGTTNYLAIIMGAMREVDTPDNVGPPPAFSGASSGDENVGPPTAEDQKGAPAVIEGEYKELPEASEED